MKFSRCVKFSQEQVNQCIYTSHNLHPEDGDSKSSETLVS